MNLEKAVYPLDYPLDVVHEVSGERRVPEWWGALKRATDLLVAGTVLAVLSPVLLLTAAAIAIVSPGSPLFLQTRVGKDGRPFTMWKFRTMETGAHLLHERMLPLSEVDGPVLKIRNDPRLHVLGAFLRRTSIDELPNFINVLRGEMSVVGPRPPLPSEVAHYDDRAMRRLTVKPGITCLWQINGRSNVSFEYWIELDNKYIDTWTPHGDLAIIAKTIPAVVRGDGAH
jgi:lipopolysaccharide/colanic/teichoic acid biosynthesis glycosyltransferase